MKLGIIGKKIGMTQIFDENGLAIPVTVVEAGPCPIIQIKNKKTDGYSAIQIAFGKKIKEANNPIQYHFAKASVEPRKILKEFKMSETDEYKLGDDITIDIFEQGEKVVVTGTSKGKGFAGVMKRHNFSGQEASHGNEKNHRTPGSIGQSAWPSKVFKGTKMAGHYGNVKVTVRNLEVVKILKERNILLIKGAVPGANGGIIKIYKN